MSVGFLHVERIGDLLHSLAMQPTANRPYAQIFLFMNATCNSRGG